MAEFKDRFKYLTDKLTTFMRFFANQNAITRKSFEYNSFDDKEEGLFSYNSDA